MKGFAPALAAIVLVVALILLLQTDSSAPPAGPNAEKPATGGSGDGDFQVALITPGDVTDGGWNENAYKGLEKIESELGAKIYHAKAKGLPEALDSLRAYIGQDCDMVIAHAGEWWTPQFVETAKSGAHTRVFVSGNDKAAEGQVAGVRFVLEDACYVLGYIAGKITKSKTLGCVGPMKHPVIESTFKAFEAGAKSANADITVKVVWTDSWDDVAKAKEKTLALIESGVDVIFHNANNGGPGVFEAVQAHKEKGVLVFGSNDDQTDMAPDVVLASAVLDIPSVFLQVAQKVKDGSFDGQTIHVGMADGPVWVAYNEKLAERIPAEVRKEADALVEKIKNGELDVPRTILK